MAFGVRKSSAQSELEWTPQTLLASQLRQNGVYRRRNRRPKLTTTQENERQRQHGGQQQKFFITLITCHLARILVEIDVEAVVQH